MGSWFSNLHMRKTDEISTEKVCNYVRESLTEQGYAPVENATEADAFVVVLVPQNSQWISLYSEIFAHDDPDSCKKIAAPLSAQLQTDVLGIACFDSDYLYLNLINSVESADAWIGIGEGKELGITRRNNLTAWKKKVEDYPAFSVAVKNKYICAEEFLAMAEGYLGIPAEQSSFSQDCLQNASHQQDATFLYFRREQDVCHKGPQLQICNMCYAVPCFDGRKNSVSFLNVGDASCGLSVYFMGQYVLQKEITFSDVRLESLHQPSIDLELEKIQLSDGQWSYYCHVPEVLIPAGVPRRMKPEKRHQLEKERMRKLSFVPHGNPRKMLDVTVVIAPDGNTNYQAKWNIWEQHGSKEAFIDYHNRIWKRVRAFEEDPNQCLPLLKIEDFEE